jgi:predicted nucleic acid-binding protein
MSAEPIRFTLDTSILVYSVDSAAGLRHKLAVEIVDRAAELDCWMTLQAISEFYAAATRNGIVPAADATALANDWLEIFPSVAVSKAAVYTALADAAAGRAAYWDALLVATASEAGCTVILSEDLADGAKLGKVRIINPFAARGLAAPAKKLLGLDR